MEFLKWFIDVFLHLDKHLAEITQQYGTATYAILFAIVFVETGVVIMPFLPGDSLLFTAGALTALKSSDKYVMDVYIMSGLLILAAVLGDTLNYHIGKWIGPRVMKGEKSRWLNKKHLDRTHAFFEKYGGKTIIIARFMPFVRTFAPFVAGAGAMTYSKFILYNVVGAVVWVVLLVGAGYHFGNIEFVRKRFSLVILVIIFLSILPGIIEFLKARRDSAKEKAKGTEPSV